MGDQDVRESSDEQAMRSFMKALLNDVRAFEALLETDLFETGVRRIGAEQEMFVVDSACRPACSALDILERLDDERFTHELALFNLEANLAPQVLGGDCLRRMERETIEVVNKARKVARTIGDDVILTGILPTLGRSDLTLDSMVPVPRYRALNDTIVKLRGSEFELSIKGTDQLDMVHDNLMLEACNASFQVHFQVAPDEFAKLYNLAQAVTGPILATGANSPLLLGKRLWNETRVAVFEHSVDARSDVHRQRGLQPRVHFGDSWVNDSVLEIFQEDIARFRAVLTTESEEDPLEKVKRGEAPSFKALRLHNGTVYRWNRACYGVMDGVPHLRIEHRVLPSGPSIIDEVANAAFFFGLMAELAEQGDVRERMSFEDARANFFAAARYGMQAQFRWFKGKQVTAADLIRRELLPLARDGLARVKIRKRDIDRYMGVLEQRVKKQRSGARWLLDSLDTMAGERTMDERLRSITKAAITLQSKETPVHDWPLADLCDTQDWRDTYKTIGRFMTTDLFTVRPDDLIDFAASLMDWKYVRHVPVEDDSGRLAGLVSYRALLKMIARGQDKEGEVSVRDIMNANPVTVTPDCATVDAIRLMREKDVACLPVLVDDKLVGVVTEADLIGVAGLLLERFLEDDD